MPDPAALVDPWIPKTYDQFYLLEIVSILVFGAIATAYAVARRHVLGYFNLFYVLRSIGSGATFPPSLLLIVYPISPIVRALFSFEALKGVLLIAGASSAVLVRVIGL